MRIKESPVTNKNVIKCSCFCPKLGVGRVEQHSCCFYVGSLYYLLAEKARPSFSLKLLSLSPTCIVGFIKRYYDKVLELHLLAASATPTQDEQVNLVDSIEGCINPLQRVCDEQTTGSISSTNTLFHCRLRQLL